MKILLLTLNAKYIHTNNAIRLLYQCLKDHYDTTFKEYTIKDNLDRIIAEISNYDIIGFSCYIWNIEHHKTIATRLKKINPRIILLAGGPEVSYDPMAFNDYFDYIVSGEGENVILPLVDYIMEKNKIIPCCVSTKTIKNKEINIIPNLEDIPDITSLFTNDDFKNRIIYLEFSRGCPFKCSYCLSQFEDKLRCFSDRFIDNQINFIASNNIKTVKFLDRSFNINGKKFIELCEKLSLIDNHVFQFEVEPNILTDEVIQYLGNKIKRDTFRLEIGIQTLNDRSLTAVNRFQDNQKLMDNLKMVNAGGRVEVHADLIAGLPYDSLLAFKDTFNKVFALQFKELQLGFLKMLRGTKIRAEADKYHYMYNELPPYEFISNDFITSDEKEIIKNCEVGLNFMWNDQRAYHMLKRLINDNYLSDYFTFFADFGGQYNKQLGLDFHYKIIQKMIAENYIDDLKLDYLYKNRVRVKRWWGKENASNHLLVQKVHEIYPVLSLNQLQNSFITPYKNGYIIICYFKDNELLII